MTVQIEVTPETATRFQVAAAALNLPIQEYLERLATLLYAGQNGAVTQTVAQVQQKTPYELGKDYIGKIDSSIIDPAVQPHKTAFGEGLLAKYKAQGLDLP